MTIPVTLYVDKIGELKEKIDAHLSSGSLDEANADVFDQLIEHWHREAAHTLMAEHRQRRLAVESSRKRMEVRIQHIEREISEVAASLRDNAEEIRNARRALRGHGLSTEPATAEAPQTTLGATSMSEEQAPGEGAFTEPAVDASEPAVDTDIRSAA